MLPVKRHRGEPVKRHRGEPGHTRDTRDTRTHEGTRTTQTNLTTIQTHQQHTPKHPASQRDVMLLPVKRHRWSRDTHGTCGISGTMEPRGIFRWLFRPRSWPLHWPRMLGCWQPSLAAPGAVPDYFLITVDGRRMLKDVKRISFCSSHYWPTVVVASSRGGAL